MEPLFLFDYILCLCLNFILFLRDKLELKAVQDGSASYAALEKKAEIYDKLVRGELPDEEDEEKYCVDFFRKGLDKDDPQMFRENDASTPQAQNAGGGDDDDDGFLLNGAKAAGVGRTSSAVDRSQHKHFVMYVFSVFLLFLYDVYWQSPKSFSVLFHCPVNQCQNSDILHHVWC